MALIAALVLLYNKCEWFRNAVNSVINFFKETLTAVGSVAKSVFEGIGNVIGSVMDAAKATVSEKLSNIKTAYEEHGGGISGVAAAAMEAVKGWYTAGYTFIDNLTGGKLSEIRGKFSTAMSNIVQGISQKFTDARTAFSNGLNNIKNAVSGAVTWFFDSIDRSVLKQIIAKRFKKLKKKYPEKYEDFLRFYRLLCKVIDSSPEGERGIPLGNVSSQDFANIYLNELDQFCIRFLGATLYTRYMDDVVVIAPNKEIAREWLAKIKVFLQERLHLETNQKTKIFYVRQGVNAYGFKIKATHLLLRTESKRREKRRIKRMMEKLQEGTITKAAIVQSVNSWLGFARWACAYNLAKKIFAPYRFIKTEGEIPYAYTIDDADGDTLTVVEELNDETIRTINNAPKGEELTVTITSEKLYALGLNSVNTLKITVTDGKGGTAYRRVTFKRTNSAPTISGQDKALGLKNGSFAENYTVSDVEGDNVVVTEFVDDVQIRSYQATLGQQETIELTREKWLSLTNGQHQLRIEAVDGNFATSVRVFSFSKKETVIKFELVAPEETDAAATKVLVTPTWKIEGAVAKVEACNNGFDAVPTWEDITAMVQINRVYNFTNKTKTASKWGVNIRFTITKNEGFEGEVSISGFGGAYE